MRSHSESDSVSSIHPFRLSVRTALAVLLFTVLLPGVVLADDPESQKEKERQALLKEAQEAVQTSEEEAKTRARTPGQSGQRVQSLLNPEISFLGDFSYNWSDQAIRNEFFLRSAELAMQAPLDPYTRFKTFITGEQEPTVLEFAPGGGILPPSTDPAPTDEVNLSVEEAYIEWVGLPLHAKVRVGKFRQQFGTLNRWHSHALPSTDRPLALRNVFGDEGLIGLGAGVDFKLPPLWADSNSLTVEITNGDNTSVFAGAQFSDPSILLRHTGFFDLGDWSYVEIGLTGLTGPNNADGSRDTKVGGIDFNYLWQPKGKGRHKGLVVRGEFIRSLFEEPDGSKVGANSWYVYATWQAIRNLYFGVRVDDADLVSDRAEIDPAALFEPGMNQQALTAYVTYWESEFVRLRFQVQRAERDVAMASGPMDDNRAWFQVTFAAGPHKHESY